MGWEVEAVKVIYPWETVEVGVGVGAALRAVDHVEVCEREVESLGKGFNPSSQ